MTGAGDVTAHAELAPGIDGYTLDTPPPASALPDENGLYPVPVPGKYDPFA